MSSPSDGSSLHPALNGFASKYQSLFERLSSIWHAQPNPDSSSEESKTELFLELREASEDAPALRAATKELFGSCSPPPERLVDFGISAYRELDYLAESRTLLGGLWACAVDDLPSADRTTFLLLLSRDPHEVFLLLDLAAVMFQRTRFGSAELVAWVANAYPRVRNDAHQGFWHCLNAFCTSSPEEALRGLESSLDLGIEALPLEITPHMIRSIRSTRSDVADIASKLQRVEEKFKAPGNPSWRALYLQSWVNTDQPLGEIGALKLRNDCYRAGSAEETAWCLLLSSIVQTDRDSWSWAYREMLRVEGNGLLDESKRWLLLATIHGFVTADKDDSVQVQAWSELLSTLLPIQSEHLAVWRQIEDKLELLAVRDYERMVQLIEKIADKSGRTWIQFLDGDLNKHFFRILSAKQLAQATSTHLCFGSPASTRHLGILIFDECEVQELAPTVVHSATHSQIELLLLEAERRPMGVSSLGRLHGCLVERVDELNDGLPELFYDSVSRQSMNTSEYRLAISNTRPQNLYLQAVLQDVKERLSNTHDASSSPALCMQVPGQIRAEHLNNRRFSRQVSEGIKQHSIFMSLVPTVHMLYGGPEPRITTRQNKLSMPLQMHSASASVEAWRLEFIDPEGEWLRRASAGVRLKSLEQSEEGME